MNCLHCGATTTNGLALCELCQRWAASCLDHLPTYFANLARWKPGRAGSRPVPGSRVLYDGDEPKRGDRVEDALDEVSNAVATWVRWLLDSRPQITALRPVEAFAGNLSDLAPADQFRHACNGLGRWLVSIATTDWCGQLVTEIGAHEETLRALTEAVAPGWYAGACRRCKAPTHVIPGLTWVTCNDCGATTYARDHLDTVLDEARGWKGGPRAIAEAVVALVDTEQSVPKLCARIRQWASRGDLEPIHQSKRDHVYDIATDSIVVSEVKVGRARYRFGDVFDLLTTTRATDQGERAS